MFILKVYDIAHGDQFVQWSDDGTTFWVTDIERFSQDILPKYFKHNNYTSFVRQLSSYGNHSQPTRLAATRRLVLID